MVVKQRVGLNRRKVQWRRTNRGPGGVANIGLWACADELVRVCIKSKVFDGEERVYERNNI